MTISSFITLMSLVDLGLGNGLVNTISQAHGTEDRAMARKAVSAGFFMLLAIGLGLGCLFAGVFQFVSWDRLFNVTSDAAKGEVGLTVVIFFGTFLLGTPLSVVQRTQMGYQEGFASNLWQATGNLVGLVLVLVAIYFKAGLPLLVAAMAGSPVFVLLLNFVIYFFRLRPWLAPRWADFSLQQARGLIRTGLLFFLLQALALVGGSTDNLIIAHTLGPEAVATYAVTMRLAVILSFPQFFISPLWPAFGEAMARGDFCWVERMLWRTVRLILWIAGPTAALMLFFGKWTISAWVGANVVPSTVLLSGFAAWTFLACYGGALAVFLNNGRWLARQVKLYFVATIIAFCLKLLLVRYWGEGGVVWATVLGYTLFFTIPATWLVKTILREFASGEFEKREADQKLA